RAKTQVKYETSGCTRQHELAEVGHGLEPALLCEVSRHKGTQTCHQSHTEQSIGPRLNGEDDTCRHHHHDRGRLELTVVDLDREHLEDRKEDHERKPPLPDRSIVVEVRKDKREQSGQCVRHGYRTAELYGVIEPTPASANRILPQYEHYTP